MILLIRWSTLVAWVLTGTSIYTALMIFGHIKALTKRHSTLEKNTLVLKNGLIATVHIDLGTIEKAELCSEEILDPDKKIGNLGLSKVSTNHNVALYFNKKQTIEKVYGITQECERLLLYIDNKNDFVQKINDAIANQIFSKPF